MLMPWHDLGTKRLQRPVKVKVEVFQRIDFKILKQLIKEYRELI